jgi:hypothetical protein
MGRISMVEHKGKTVLVQDFTGLGAGDEFSGTIAEAKRYIAGQPPKSVLSLFDATRTHYNAEVMAQLKEFTKHNGPYIKASVVVGIEGILSIAVMAVSRFTGRPIKILSDRESAMDWLVEQP